MPTTNDDGYRSYGNALHGLNVVSVLAYTVMVLAFAKPGVGIFDEQWVADGFCLIDTGAPYRSTHFLCLYWDIALVLICWVIYCLLRNSRPEMKLMDDLMKFSMLGHLAHGAAHGFLAVYEGQLKDSGSPDRLIEHLSQQDAMKVAPGICVLLCFWFGMLKGSIPKFSNATISMLAVLATIGHMHVKAIFVFGYVQAVVVIAFAAAQVGLPDNDKDFGYFATSAANTVVTLMSWVEAFACQSVASKFGGHLIYDASIPICLGLSYVASWLHYHNNDARESNRTKKEL
eukprot:scaffold5901_cov116-Cylindrotheca_fusiformis.AAC.15